MIKGIMALLTLNQFYWLQSLIRKNLFVHFVLDPIAISDSAAEVSFAARFGCLVLIENVSFQTFLTWKITSLFISSTNLMLDFQVERLDVGALITIRGIGRVKIIKFFQVNKCQIKFTITQLLSNNWRFRIHQQKSY